MAHAIVPGIVIGFVIAGLSVTSMIIGGPAGIMVALLTSLLARFTIIREDKPCFALLISLALGIFICRLPGRLCR